MKRKFIVAVALTAGVALGAPVFTAAADKDTKGEKADTYKADNTKMNKGSDKQVTADQQKMNAADRKLTQQIRRAVVKDKSLSTYGHNVKIISMGGMVTLKGPVRDEAEKAKIEQIATQAMGGQGKVTNELTVAPKEKKEKKEKKETKKEHQKEKKE